MSTHLTLCPDVPTPGEQRRVHLSRLAEVIHSLGITALVALADSDHPVLYTVQGGRRVAVVAVEVGGAWSFIWGKHHQVPAERPDVAAVSLAQGATRATQATTPFAQVRQVSQSAQPAQVAQFSGSAGRVAALLAARPQPRGTVKAVA